MNRFTLIGALALFTLAACDDKKPETKTDDPAAKNATTTTTASVATPTTAATATGTAMAASTINDSDIATPADFEESAEKAIDKKNYKAELSTLETDIAKE